MSHLDIRPRCITTGRTICARSVKVFYTCAISACKTAVSFFDLTGARLPRCAMHLALGRFAYCGVEKGPANKQSGSRPTARSPDVSEEVRVLEIESPKTQQRARAAATGVADFAFVVFNPSEFGGGRNAVNPPIPEISKTSRVLIVFQMGTGHLSE